MAQFQKPENALKRAEELIDVGKKQNALDVLKEALNHRKWRNNWSITIEHIIKRHLELCVELKKIPYAREGLHQYRGTCQAANIGSLELVVQSFRKSAEEKVNEAKKQQEGLDAKKMDDLDECEAPQTILLRAIQAHDTRQQSQDREVTSHFRFLWDTYRVILDVLKSNVRLEEVYHETAQHAFEFCRTNKRPQEFKRLCETLRKNYLDLSKPRTPNQHQVNPSNPETVTRTIDTRFAQLRTATELDLWREAYNTATEIYDLMNKAKTKLKTRSEYYEYLGQIFWKSDNYLFHSFACLKNVLFVKAVKRDLSKEDLCLMASKALMATLCVPFQRNSDIQTTLELTTEGASSPYEKAKKHSALFNAQSVPTRDTIIGQLIEKNLLQHAAEPCRKLFALIESDFTPLSLCQDAKPFLDLISETNDVCDGKLAHYITPVKQIIFFRLMKQLSEVYANMTIENFERAASIVPFSIAEKWMANAARQQGLSIQINYREQTIIFGNGRKVDMKSMRQPLIEIGHKLQQAMQRVAPEEQNKKEKLEKQALQQNIVKRIEEERGLIRQRREEIERRKEENERKKEQQEREAAEKIRKQEEKEAEAERKRQQEERAKREVEREEQKKRDAKMKETKDMLEAMKKQDESKPTNLKIGGKKIGDIQAEDIEGIDLNQLERAREQQVTRERQEKIRQRKLESKRVDHVSRAMREEEKSKLADWAEKVQISDTEFLNAATARDEAEQLKTHEAALVEKQMLVVFQEQKDSWVEEQLATKYEEHLQLVKDKQEKARQAEAEAKMERARKRRDAAAQEKDQKAKELVKQEADRKQKAQDEKRRAIEAREAEERAEEEEAERAEEEERKAKEKEARDAKRKEDNEARDRIDQKRRDKEREIEERLAGGGKKEQEAAPKPAGGGGWRDREAAKAAGGGGDDRAPAPRAAAADKDDGDNWRSAGARKEAPRAGGGDGGSWRDREVTKGGDDEKPSERPTPAWKRPAAKAEAAPRQEEREEKPKASPWGRKPAGDDEEERKPAPAAARREPEAKEAAPEAAGEEEDDGFAVVQKGKKKIASAAPWRKSSTEAAGDDKPSTSTRDAWKSKGADAGEPAPAAARPWNKPK